METGIGALGRVVGADPFWDAVGTGANAGGGGSIVKRTSAALPTTRCTARVMVECIWPSSISTTNGLATPTTSSSPLRESPTVSLSQVS